MHEKGEERVRGGERFGPLEFQAVMGIIRCLNTGSGVGGGGGALPWGQGVSGVSCVSGVSRSVISSVEHELMRCARLLRPLGTPWS